jgi:hypothetical protein
MTIEARQNDEQDAYKLPKILSKRFTKGSSDAAREAEVSEAGGAEGGFAAGSEVRMSLLVRRTV